MFVFLSFTAYCQQNLLLPPDSLLKLNKVKKAVMTSIRRKGNGKGETIYNYNKNGVLTKSYSLSPISNRPFIITDYFFDSSGNRYASVMHGGEEYSSYSSSTSGSSWTWSSGFPDSILYYYEYNKEKKLARLYRKFPSGELMNETVYNYNPLTVVRKSFDTQRHLTSEWTEFYEKEAFIINIIEKKYDSIGNIISRSTQDFQNIYNSAGQITEVNYKNDTCSCISHYKYYSNGLIKSRSNVACLWDKKFRYKYYKKDLLVTITYLNLLCYYFLSHSINQPFFLKH